MNTLSTVRPLRSEADYEAALAAISPYFDNEPAEGTEAADHFDLLALVIEKYQNEHYEIPAAEPLEVVKFIMEENGRSRAELAEILGGQSRVSEFFKGRRDLSLSQMRRLHAEWRIPFEALLGAMTTV
jgi:HTH-type transcriptional regulator/antitoxin HigA